MADSLGNPAFWVMISIALYLAAAIARWWVDASSEPRVRQLRQRWLAWRFAPLVAGSVRFLYYLGLPYLALVQGSIDLRTFGLIGADLPAAAAVGLAAAIVTLAVFALAWHSLQGASAEPAAAGPTTGKKELPWAGLLDAVQAQAHWALYRSWPILVMGTYAGVFVGFGLVAAESLLGLLLARAGRPEGSYIWERGLTRLGLAWVSGLVFLATNSLAACLLLHAVLVLAPAAHLEPPAEPAADGSPLSSQPPA